MAITHARVAVSTVPVALNTASLTSGQRLYVVNTTANVASLGGSGVTAAGGYLLAGNASAVFDLSPGDVLFAIRDGGTDTTIAVVRN